MENTMAPGSVPAENITGYSRRELCEFASKLCAKIKEEAGPASFRGGIRPGNVTVDEDGSVSIGPGKTSGWNDDEVKFIAPELYWHGEGSPASDVYSVGMLLYYALNGGKLPFEDVTDAESAYQRRMSGETFPVPKAAGRRLGEIIAKAISFNAGDRYSSMEEMKAMLDSCVKNLYLNGVPSAEAIFNKSDDDLTEIERMMVSIIEHEHDEPAKDGNVSAEKPETEEAAEEENAAEPAASEEETAEETNGAVNVGEETKPETETEAEASETITEEAAEETSKAVEEPAAAEDVKEYIPASAKEETAPSAEEKKEPIVILTEEKNPELAPVTARQPVRTPAVQYGKSLERERKIAEQVKKRRRRPAVMVLALCAVLIIAAILYNALTNDPPKAEPTPEPTPGIEFTVVETPELTVPENTAMPDSVPEETAAPETAKEHSYEIFLEDVSWTEARDRCIAMGGHLVVISSETEFYKVADMAEEIGASRVWVGCHRIDGTLVWENTDPVNYYPWADGEPSYYDSGDDVEENYIMMWDRWGWQYNDSRDDPVADYPEMYSGVTAYVCEYE